MASIETRPNPAGGQTYRVKVRLRGAPPETATFTRLTDAKRWAESTQAAIREGRHFKNAQAKRRTCGELIDKYLIEVLPKNSSDQRNRAAQLTWWKAQIGTLKLCELTSTLLSRQRDLLLKSGVRKQAATSKNKTKSPATVRRYLAALSHALTVAVKELAWLDENPLLKVSKPPESAGRTRFLSKAELGRLVLACNASDNPHLHTIVVLAVSSGMRKGEMLWLRRKDVDLERKQIFLEHTKNGDKRVVPLASRALSLLTERLAQPGRSDDLLFPGKNSKRPTEIDSSWRTCLTKAGINEFRFHDLRHSAGTFLLESGASLPQLLGALGHKTVAMAKRYAHVSEPLSAQLIANMNAHIFEEP